MNLYLILFIVFIVLVILVGGYVIMFLHIMRSDPREIDYRKVHGEDSGLVPKKNSSSSSSK
jgi:hypothetical protein